MLVWHIGQSVVLVNRRSECFAYKQEVSGSNQGDTFLFLFFMAFYKNVTMEFSGNSNPLSIVGIACVGRNGECMKILSI